MAYDKRNNSRNRQRQNRQRQSVSKTNSLTRNDFMQTPFHPNWNTIYKELNENGIDNLTGLPIWVTKQMNDSAYNPTASVLDDGSPYATWAKDNGIKTKSSIFNSVTNDVETNIVVENKTPKYPTKEKLNNIEDSITAQAGRIAENNRIANETKIEEVVSKDPLTINDLIANEKLNQELDNLHMVDIKAHEDALAINKEINSLEIDAAHKEALKIDRKINRQQYKEEKIINKITNNVETQEAFKRKERKAREVKETLARKDAEIKIKERERQSRQTELNEVFDSPDYERIYEKTYEAKRAKKFPKNESITPEKLDENIKLAENEYKIAVESKKLSPEEINKANQKVVDAISEKKNYENMLDYERKRKEFRQNNPEDSYKLDEKRFKARTKVTDDAANIVDDAAEKAFKQQMEEEAAKNLKKSTMKNLGHVMNAGFAIMDYKDAREAGHSVGGSVLRAGAEFAKGELLGGWYMAAMLAKSVPTMAVSAVEGINTMSRSMNSMQRRQVFGDVEFMDTQQLATMRQSGMELAKMSQYNLQQTLMGNEAEHLHRL